MPELKDYIYLAGIIDGEGHIGVNPSNFTYRAILTIASTNMDLIDYLKSTFGGNTHRGSRAGQYGNNKACTHWQMSGAKLLHLLEQTEEYMIVKKEQSRLARQFLETLSKTPGKGLSKDIWVLRASIHQQLKSLNRKGIYV